MWSSIEERFCGFRVRRVVKVIAVLRDEEVLAHAVDSQFFPRGLPNLDEMACDFVFVYEVGFILFHSYSSGDRPSGPLNHLLKIGIPILSSPTQQFNIFEVFPRRRMPRQLRNPCSGCAPDWRIESTSDAVDGPIVEAQ